MASAATTTAGVRWTMTMHPNPFSPTQPQRTPGLHLLVPRLGGARAAARAFRAHRGTALGPMSPYSPSASGAAMAGGGRTTVGVFRLRGWFPTSRGARPRSGVGPRSAHPSITPLLVLVHPQKVAAALRRAISGTRCAPAGNRGVGRFPNPGRAGTHTCPATRAGHGLLWWPCGQRRGRFSRGRGVNPPARACFSKATAPHGPGRRRPMRTR